MTQRLEVPPFTSEAEEARWWFDNQDTVADELELAGSEGRLGQGTAMRRLKASKEVVTLEPEDVHRAREQAKRRGMEYESYLRMVVHRALLVEEKSV